MIKLGSMCLLAGVLCAAGGVLAADGVKKHVIPDLAWTICSLRLMAGQAPSFLTRPIPMCLTTTARDRPIGLRIFPIRSCSPGPSQRRWSPVFEQVLPRRSRWLASLIDPD
jgi:hypothetical protein